LTFGIENKWLFGIGYILSIILGNILVAWFGLVHMWGLTFPSGAIIIGLTFSLRDFVQRSEFGHKVWYFMLTATVITCLMSFVMADMPIPPWRVAMASSIAFMVSEFIDWLIYTVFKKDIVWRITISNLFSTPVDSILFVGIAFNSYRILSPPVYGQSIVKYLSGLLVIPIIIYFRRIK
jgi:uncharacterized PurR-regulated membrane protein YhhQ (DUF165 family)